MNLELLKGTNTVNHVLYGQGYTLKAHFSQPDGKYPHRYLRDNILIIKEYYLELWIV